MTTQLQQKRICFLEIERHEKHEHQDNCLLLNETKDIDEAVAGLKADIDQIRQRLIDIGPDKYGLALRTLNEVEVRIKERFGAVNK